MRRAEVFPATGVRASRISLAVTVCGDATTVVAGGKVVCGDSAAS